MTNKFFSAGKIYQYYMPLSLVLFMFITIERQIKIIPDGPYDRLYGLPFPWVSNSFAYSLHYQVHVLPLFFNLGFFFGLVLLLFAGLRKLRLKLKTHWVPAVLSTLVLLFFLLLSYYHLMDSDIYSSNQFVYKTISSKLIFILP